MLDKNGAKCTDIREKLIEIEEGFGIEFNHDSERYHISFNGSLFQTVGYKDVTRELLADIRHTVWLNKTAQMLEYVDQQNAKIEASKERKLSNYSEDLAKDMRKPLIESYYGG